MKVRYFFVKPESSVINGTDELGIFPPTLLAPNCNRYTLNESLDISLISNYITGMKTRDAVSLISKIKEKSSRFILTEMAAQGIHDLAISHGDIIYTLYNHQRLTMAEIAKNIRKDKSTVTALVDKLVRTGYVAKERDAADSRIIHVALTPKGEALQPIFEDISQRLLDTFYTDVTDDEKNELLRILIKIQDNF